MIILDNSDLYYQGSQSLRENGLLEVDFTGFAPMVDYTSTTSIYFHRNFNFKPRYARQPIYGIGRGVKDRTKIWE